MLPSAERERADDEVGRLRAANEKLTIANVRMDEMTEALRASEEQFRTLANTVPMLAWFANPDGYVPWYNQRWFDYTGTTLAEQEGWQWRSVHDPIDLPRVVARWREALVTGEPWEDVSRLRRHDGVYRWFLSRALPLRNKHGRIVRWFGTSVDIDDQKRAEADARAAIRAKDDFLAMLSHELRNPLAPIVTVLEMVAGHADSPIAPRALAVITHQVDTLVRLVDDLLDVSRFAAGKVSMHLQYVELAAVVAAAVETAAPLLELKRHHLTIDVAADGLGVDGDMVRLAQVVANLLTNAAKYTPPDGAIAITAARAGADVVMRIRDDGIGISAEMLPRIFEMFVQEQQSVDRPAGGLGLGLSIVKSIMELHGGTAEAHSDGLGRGTEFVLRLPASCRRPAEPPKPAAPTATERTWPGPCRILVVDDNADAAESMAESLAMVGHEVRVAFDGLEALGMIGSFVPEIAVVDIGLPGMDGYALAAALRERLQPHPPVVVALSGYPRTYRPSGSVDDFAFDLYLVKPVTMARLLAGIGEVAACCR